MVHTVTLIGEIHIDLSDIAINGILIMNMEIV